MSRSLSFSADELERIRTCAEALDETPPTFVYRATLGAIGEVLGLRFSVSGREQNGSVRFSPWEMEQLNRARVLVSAGDFHLSYDGFIHQAVIHALDEAGAWR